MRFAFCNVLNRRMRGENAGERKSMLIGIISDTHDNLDRLRAAISTLKSRGAARLIHCGDIVSPFVVKAIAEAGFEECFGVFGNNDGELIYLSETFKKIGRIAKPPAFIEMGGARFAVLHEPMPDDAMAALPVDAVLFGHTHQPVLKDGKPVIVNPGECCGWLTGKSTIAVFDTAGMKAELIEL